MFPEVPDARPSRSTTLGPRTPAAAAARTWVRRLVRGLVLLDSWTPDTHRTSSPQAARRQLRAEWSHSGDLTEPQAAALVTLDETTPWTV